MKKVLITGMSGLIGGILREHLETVGGYELSALNRSPVESVKCHQADITDLEAIKPAFEGIDAVVHLAAVKPPGVWPYDEPADENLIGVYNVFEAARLAGVQRIVFASSGGVSQGWELVSPYKAIAEGRYGDLHESWPMITRDQVRPMSIYNSSKLWGEALGRHMSDLYGISILCVRLGTTRPENRPGTTRELATYISHRDCADVLHRSMEAPDELKYEVYFAHSDNKWGYPDPEHVKKVLGWEPRDSADDFDLGPL